MPETPRGISPRNVCVLLWDRREASLCRAPVAPPAAAKAPKAKQRPGAPAVTLTDIAAFRPDPGPDLMEPDGWTIAGLDANIHSRPQQQVVAGTLLGRPADVRFTAVSWHWQYGDGSGADRDTPGGTWAELGVAEFEPTPTSHVYATDGDYVIHLQISYTAEYRFDGSGWTAIDGIITLASNDLVITVGGAHTVLVDRDCAAAPSGPGC